MRIAALYDIHGNLPALEATLEDILAARPDLIVVGGDVLPGPMPGAVLDRLLALDTATRFIHGNGEKDILAVRAGREPSRVPAPYREPVRWSAQQLTAEHERAIASWPLTCRIDHETLGAIVFCHASPRNDSDIFTRNTPEPTLLPLFEDVNAALVVCGHTHMQFDRRVGATRVVNAGSVGMPFGEPGAYWLLLDDDVHLRHTRYDLAAAAERIRAGDYPLAEEFATGSVAQPRSEQEMLAIFDRVALASE